MTNNTRKIIKAEMVRLGAERYRITAADEVHFYGRMPNSIETGWWLAHQNAADYAAEIEADAKDASDYVGHGQFK